MNDNMEDTQVEKSNAFKLELVTLIAKHRNGGAEVMYLLLDTILVGAYAALASSGPDVGMKLINGAVEVAGLKYRGEC